mmetsp:Transcript_80693/g.261523  ORF Transcript_80693/g.261523 Transcript_80693/m.261523 type:complete len:211 (+) Transcript_80693:691-1323(+)
MDPAGRQSAAHRRPPGDRRLHLWPAAGERGAQHRLRPGAHRGGPGAAGGRGRPAGHQGRAEVRPAGRPVPALPHARDQHHEPAELRTLEAPERHPPLRDLPCALLHLHADGVRRLPEPLLQALDPPADRGASAVVDNARGREHHPAARCGRGSPAQRAARLPQGLEAREPLGRVHGGRCTAEAHRLRPRHPQAGGRHLPGRLRHGALRCS